jgi:DNA-binding transcriptional ArsR family regulator
LTPARRDRLVAVHRALGDATRLEVFRLIAAQTAPICVCDIVDRFSVSQPTISHNLETLRDVGLVKVSRRGVWAFDAAGAYNLVPLACRGGGGMPTTVAEPRPG